MNIDLRSLFSLEPGQTDALDAFIGHRLFEAKVWASPRTSDGITHLRVVECEPERLRVCGRIFEIDQTLHSFWLDLEREHSGSGVTWALYFDVAGSPRTQQNAIDTYDDAREIDWRVALAGRGEFRNGALVVSSTVEADPITDLRRVLELHGHRDVSSALADAVAGGSTASEILGRVGLVLKTYATTRAGLAEDERRNWDAVIDMVQEVWPHLV